MCFWVSLAGGALLVARAHGGVQLAATWVLTLSAAAVRLAMPTTPELVAGALFIGLGCAGGLALPWAWIHAGPVSGVLLLTGGCSTSPGQFAAIVRFFG